MEDLIARVREILTTTPERWLKLADCVDAASMRQVPVEGEWTAVEALTHLLDTELGAFRIRLESFLEGRPRLAAFDPDAAGMRPDPCGEPIEIARRFADERMISIDIFDRVTDADLDRSAVHEELGIVTLREMLGEWAAHDLNHTMQGERALMQPFIDTCGPWRSYFVDHDLSLPR